jgi:hypothetical protein
MAKVLIIAGCTIAVAIAGVIGTAVPVHADEPRENVVFWYQSDSRPDVWGEAKQVFSASDPDAIRANGSEPWRYTTIARFPDLRAEWNGTTPEQRPEWRLCNEANPAGIPDTNTPIASRGKAIWYWADFNERSYSDAVVAWAQQLRAAGWTGLMLDTGGRLLGAGSRLRNVVSTCTSSPMVPGARNVTAYLNLIQRIRATGLKVGQNNLPDDISPDYFDILWRENIGNRAYPAHLTLRQATVDSQRPYGSVIEMGKSLSLGTHPNKSAKLVYAWARAKLAGQPVAVNTGIDQCHSTGQVAGCLRMGIPTDLVNLRLGRAKGSVRVQDCDPGTAHCIVTRHFEKGLIAVNLSDRVRTLVVNNARCRVMVKHRSPDSPLRGGACVKNLTAKIWPHRAWIVMYQD